MFKTAMNIGRFRGFSTWRKGPVSLPHHVDWRKTKGVLSPIKDQGNAGRCAASLFKRFPSIVWFVNFQFFFSDKGLCGIFADVASVESIYKIRRNVSVELSVQHVIYRLARKFKKRGIDISETGLTDSHIFDCIMINGIPLEEDSPYVGVPSMKDDFIPLPQFKNMYTIDSYKSIYPDEHNIMKHVVQQPICATVDASTWSKYGKWEDDKVKTIYNKKNW
jgi:hypothetical protein